jgi:hypothetical protein
MKLLLLIPILALTGCATEATQKRMTDAQNMTTQCIERIATMRERIAANQVQLKDSRDQLILLMVQQMAQQGAQTEMAMCDDLAVAQINGQSLRTSKLIDGSFRVGSFALGIVGLDMIVDGITDLGNGGSSEVWNVEGSRVVNRSTATGGSTISSSGEGLGIGNVFGRNTAQGGIEPRQWQTGSGTTVTDISTESQSGENAPVQPVDGGTATQLPVE